LTQKQDDKEYEEKEGDLLIVGDMAISDDATKSQLTYAQAVKGLKKSVAKKSFLSRTKDKHLSATDATAIRPVVRFSAPIPRARE
jgi:hypothetical protein